MTYAIQHPPDAHVVFASNCRAATRRWRNRMPASTVTAIRHGCMVWTSFAVGARVTTVQHPSPVSEQYIDWLASSRNLVELPPFIEGL